MSGMLYESLKLEYSWYCTTNICLSAWALKTEYYCCTPDMLREKT